MFLIPAVVIMLTGCQHYKNYDKITWQEKELPDWENTAINTINTERPHASMVSFPDNASALKAGWRQSVNVMSLDGVW